MVFKRRTPKSWGLWALHLLWPSGGWGRAFEYVKLRLRRLPDTPQKISRGIFAGVFTAFTPFYGLHFIVAAILAFIMRGNVLASLMATFFGNPLTYLPIAVVSLRTGHFLLGTEFTDPAKIGQRFGDAGRDLWQNFVAIFTDDRADWTGLINFFDEVFLPYLVGGLIPGVIAACVCYFLSVPIIAAYQNRRKGRLREKLDEIRNRNKQDTLANSKNDEPAE